MEAQERLLTHRQSEVLLWIARGLPYKQAAKTLGISAQTVKNHMEVVRQKLGAYNTPHAIAIAIRGGLV